MFPFFVWDKTDISSTTKSGILCDLEPTTEFPVWRAATPDLTWTDLTDTELTVYNEKTTDNRALRLLGQTRLEIIGVEIPIL